MPLTADHPVDRAGDIGSLYLSLRLVSNFCLRPNMQNVLKHVSDQLSYLTGKCRRKFSVFGLWWCYWWRICLFTFSKNWNDLVWYVGLRPNFSITSRFAYYLGLRRNYWSVFLVCLCICTRVSVRTCVLPLEALTSWLLTSVEYIFRLVFLI